MEVIHQNKLQKRTLLIKKHLTVYLGRNHYDRIGHMAQGLTPAMIAREVLLRRSPLVEQVSHKVSREAVGYLREHLLRGCGDTPVVLLPGISLIPVMVLTQVLNAVLLLPLLVFMVSAGRDVDLMGDLATGRRSAIAQGAVIAVVTVCVGALGVLAVT